MVHRTQIINGIGTQESVYWDLRLGNLDRTQVGKTVSFPLQDRFHSDSKRSFPVAIYSQTTRLAFIQRIVSRLVSRIDCTAAGTPFGSVISINFVKGNLEHLAVGFKEFLELLVRNFANLLVGFPVKLSSFTSDIFQFLNRNISIMRFGKIYNFFGNLTASCSDKISLLDFKPLKASFRSMRVFIGKAFQISPSFYISSLLSGNIPTKIKLFNNFAGLNVKDSRRSKSRRANVNANNISLIGFWLFKFFFKNNRNLAVLKERDIVKSPSITQKRLESFILPIGLNRNYKRLSWRISNFKTGIPSLRFDILEPSLIESNRTFSKFKISVIARLFNAFSIFPSVFSGFLNYVAWQKGVVSYV